MKRSAQEILELVVFGLVAIIIGTGLVWFVGWLLGFVGLVFTWLAGLVWALLRFLIPLAVVVGGVYLVVRLLNNNASAVASDAKQDYSTPPSPWTMRTDVDGASAQDDSAPAADDAEAGDSSTEPSDDEPPAPATN